MITENIAPATLLVVDDNPVNLSVIMECLYQGGYQNVLIAMDGETALQRAELGKPDLILLDIMMPGLDGYETCERLKQHPELREISVIFMSAMAETVDKVKGLKIGAVDYITKPFQQEEVLARIETHLTIRRLRQELLARNRQLEEEIEQRKRTESFLRIQQDLSLDGILVTNHKGECLTHNRRWLDIWGLTLEQLKEIPHDQPWRFYQSLVQEKDRVIFDKISPRDGTTKSQVFEYQLENSRMHELYNTPMLGEQGKQYGWACFIRDVTERRLVEQSLRDLNASKDKFFSILAHDLNNPFQGILGFTEFFTETIDMLSKEEIADFAKKMNESARSIFKLLQELLSWSRLQIGHMEYRPSLQELHEMAEYNVQLNAANAREKKIQLVNRIPVETFIYADPNMTNTMLRNLIGNAVKFTRPEGTITVSCVEHPHFLEISVTDTGVGMNEESITKLFRIDKHLTTTGTSNEKGTGLGLVLVKEMVERNGGKIAVESTPDVGSRFYFTLPRPTSTQIEAGMSARSFSSEQLIG